MTWEGWSILEMKDRIIFDWVKKVIFDIYWGKIEDDWIKKKDLRYILGVIPWFFSGMRLWQSS